jgi:hypothetical protein
VDSDFTRIVDGMIREEMVRLLVDGSSTGEPRGFINDPGMRTAPRVIDGHCWDSTPEEVARGNSTAKPPVARPERPADPFPYWARDRPTVDLRRVQVKGLLPRTVHRGYKKTGYR